MTEERKVESFRMSVDLPSLLLTCAKEVQAPGVTIGFQMALINLNIIAKRAQEIQDEVILEELKHLGLLEEK